MRYSTLFPVSAALLLVGLLASSFVLPRGYTLSSSCATCQGSGRVHCSTCNGSGKCWVCGGTGTIWFMPESDNWCAACGGTGVCYDCHGAGLRVCVECGGSGILYHWMYNSVGFMVVLSIINIFLFLGLLVLEYVVSDFYLGFNQWVYDVEDMGFWFNASFMTWLFAKHPIRWLKWQSGINFMLAVYFGVLLFGIISLSHVTSESFVLGVLLSALVTLLFSILFYRSFASRVEENITA